MDDYKEVELIVTATYSVKESKGNALGLEGNQALFIVGGVIVSFLLMFYGMMNGWSFMSLIGVVITPPVISYIYVLLFLKGRPPGYQKALLHGLILGSDDDVKKENKSINPYYREKRKNLK